MCLNQISNTDIDGRYRKAKLNDSRRIYIIGELNNLTCEELGIAIDKK